MKRTSEILNILLAAGMLLIAAPSLVKAESGVPDPGAFFGTFPEYQPNARGTMITGTMTISYVFVDAFACADPGLPEVPQLLISNMYVVLTLQQNTKVPPQPFNTNLVRSGTPVFCFSTGTRNQIDVVLNLINDYVVPHFNGCIAGVTCPTFKIKSLSNFTSTGTGAISSNITIAIQ